MYSLCVEGETKTQVHFQLVHSAVSSFIHNIRKRMGDCSNTFDLRMNHLLSHQYYYIQCCSRCDEESYFSGIAKIGTSNSLYMMCPNKELSITFFLSHIRRRKLIRGNFLHAFFLSSLRQLWFPERVWFP